MLLRSTSSHFEAEISTFNQLQLAANSNGYPSGQTLGPALSTCVPVCVSVTLQVPIPSTSLKQGSKLCPSLFYYLLYDRRLQSFPGRTLPRVVSTVLPSGSISQGMHEHNLNSFTAMTSDLKIALGSIKPNV